MRLKFHHRILGTKKAPLGICTSPRSSWHLHYGGAFEFMSVVGKEYAVTLRRMGAERTNLTQNHPLGSYKDDRITQGCSAALQRALPST